MIEKTRRAMVRLLRDVFPMGEVPQLHLSPMADGFARPALYLHLMPYTRAPMASGMRAHRLRWQVVYFPPLDAAGNEHAPDLHRAAEKLADALESPTLWLEDKTGVHMMDPNIDTRDGVCYATVVLQCAMAEDPQAPTNLMQTVVCKIKEDTHG